MQLSQPERTDSASIQRQALNLPLDANEAEVEAAVKANTARIQKETLGLPLDANEAEVEAALKRWSTRSTLAD